MGNGADKIINVLEQKGIKYDGIFASDGFVRDKVFHGFKISSYGELKKKFGDMVVLLCFGSDRDDVRQNVLKIAAEQELFAPEVPVIGDGLFCAEYYLSHKDEFDFVRSHLSDELSVKTFDNIINYKISGKIDYLLDCETETDEPYKSFLNLCDNESFLDLGAYTGDTVIEFTKRVARYDSIIAAEPDFKNFKKLLLNTESLSNIRCENVGISNVTKTDTFSMQGGRNSVASKNGTKILFFSVDDLVGNSKITFIKMDIEGQELNAIIGGVNTIKQNKPKMRIAAYHRTEDFLKIPQAVLKINSDYRVYLRHFKSLPAWDTDFYFI